MHEKPEGGRLFKKPLNFQNPDKVIDQEALKRKLIKESIAILSNMYQLNGEYYRYLIDFVLAPSLIFEHTELDKRRGSLHFQSDQSQATLSLVSQVRVLQHVTNENFYFYNDKSDEGYGLNLVLVRTDQTLPDFDFSLPILCKIKYTAMVDFETPAQSYLEFIVEPKCSEFKYVPLDMSDCLEIKELQPAPAASFGMAKSDQVSECSEPSRSCCCLLFDAFRKRRSSRVSTRNYGTISQSVIRKPAPVTGVAKLGVVPSNQEAIKDYATASDSSRRLITDSRSAISSLSWRL